MVSTELHLINAMKTTYIVDQVTPLFYILTTLLMTAILMYWGSTLLIAPGIVFSEEVYITRLAEIFQYRNTFVVCLMAITWGHYPCRMQNRYVKKEMTTFWTFSFLGVYAGLWIEDYLAYWYLKSGGGYIDIYPLSPVEFWTASAVFLLIPPLLACQCTWMFVKGTLGQFFCSTFYSYLGYGLLIKFVLLKQVQILIIFQLPCIGFSYVYFQHQVNFLLVFKD